MDTAAAASAVDGDGFCTVGGVGLAAIHKASRC